MNVPAAITAQTAIARQNVALAVTKHSAEADQAIAHILEETVQTSKPHGDRGTNIDIVV